MKKEILNEEIFRNFYRSHYPRQCYKGTVKFDGNYLGQKESLPIKPGMTLAGEIKTGKKTLFQYLVKPLLRSKNLAFRER